MHTCPHMCVVHVAGQFTPKDYGQYIREGIQITPSGRWPWICLEGIQSPPRYPHTCTLPI